ncbi:hypothetical protein [Pseudomarimonas arenosa]|uniref:Anti-sigma factor n=1 Tax=Pseudomarimonas arenosa TaxID=2774145 RepID=A0AAW3ZJL0_9GAMM|nr:hypothetical protein [Pseudomarimonas arenosa]MBD8526168.1 hypothetical protein [Pseudomarimonas arenosa]
MTPISDNELVLYHFGDELSAERRQQIRDALEQDLALSRRLAVLQSTLQAADLDAVPEPDPQLGDRLWQGLAPRLRGAGNAMASSSPIGAARMQHSRRPRRRSWGRLIGGALAASLLLGVGFFAGRQAPPPTVVAAHVPETVELSSGRIYQATMVRHLNATRRALLTASNGQTGSIAEGNADLARSLLDNHRLYMAAADHQGDRRLLRLLQEIEPVLIELANPVRADDIQTRKGLGDFVEREDLIFQVRAVEAGLSARRTTSI